MGPRGGESKGTQQRDFAWPFGLSWLAKINLRLIADATAFGLEYCGTLCASIGLAAKWSYWLATGAIVLFMIQLTVWTLNWIICPLGKHAWALWKYLRGYGQWHEVAHSWHDPHDLLVTDGVAIARLRHGTLRGRTNRFGFKTECETVHSASHRYFRHQLESYNCRVHLCAGTPCAQPDLDCLHVTSSAFIPHEADLDLQDAVGRGPGFGAIPDVGSFKGA